MELRKRKKIKPVDERELAKEFNHDNVNGFLDWIKRYDNAIKPQLIAEGWFPETTSKRTLLFTLGDVTFRRRAYKRNGEWRYPVDEGLGLEKNSRHSQELLFQVARLATLMPYRQVPAVIKMVYHIEITKDTVSKAVWKVAQLFNERNEYRYFEEFAQVEKIECPFLYVEGYGVMICTTSGENHCTDLAHFVIRTRSIKVGGIKHERWELQNKREIISTSYKDAVEKLISCLTNYYNITPETTLITNSDRGRGYGIKVFKNIASTLVIKRHEHFYDAYHVNKDIKRFFKK